MLELDLIGAEILRKDGLYRERLSIAQGKIVAESVGRKLDMGGFLVLPGIIDMHGDGFERHVAPRRGAMKQPEEGIAATEAELAANGITTAYLAQFWSWEGGMRGPDFAQRIATAILGARESLATDLRMQLRFEIHMLGDYDNLPEWLCSNKIDYFVFNDHLPHKHLSQGRTPPGLVAQALKAGRSPDSHLALMRDLHGNEGGLAVPLDRLVSRLLSRGVRLGSHDDISADTRAGWRARGAKVAEFPRSQEAAEMARKAGDTIVMGAPNVVRGRSHNGGVSARDLIALGHCDALASDYHYPSLRRAALLLAESRGLSLPNAWKLVSAGPAEALGFRDRGQLEPGFRADLTILDGTTYRPAVTMAGGKITYMHGLAAERLALMTCA